MTLALVLAKTTGDALGPYFQWLLKDSPLFVWFGQSNSNGNGILAVWIINFGMLKCSRRENLAFLFHC